MAETERHEERAARRLIAMQELARIITEQRLELRRLNAKADYADERYAKLYKAIDKLAALAAHTDACHISTCPAEDGCELRDGGYLGSFMSHDCSCGLDAVRSMLSLPILLRQTEAQSREYHRKQMEDAARMFRQG